MKKQLGLFAVICLLSVIRPDATFAVTDAGMWGYAPGAYNTSDIDNEKNYRLDKSYIQTLDDVTKDEQIYEHQ